MKNTLNDLNNILFEQLERLQDDELDLDKEIKRSQAVSSVAGQIINAGELAVTTLKYMANTGNMDMKVENNLIGVKKDD